MTKLKKIWVDRLNDSAPFIIRIDWDNDRHQAITVTENSPRGVMHALIKAERLVRRELEAGEI